LFWTAQTEFVWVAAQFNARTVPFGVVGEELISFLNNPVQTELPMVAVYSDRHSGKKINPFLQVTAIQHAHD
jgi:hypothetical protein